MDVLSAKKYSHSGIGTLRGGRKLFGQVQDVSKSSCSVVKRNISGIELFNFIGQNHINERGKNNRLTSQRRPVMAETSHRS